MGFCYPGCMIFLSHRPTAVCIAIGGLRSYPPKRKLSTSTSGLGKERIKAQATISVENYMISNDADFNEKVVDMFSGNK